MRSAAIVIDVDEPESTRMADVFVGVAIRLEVAVLAREALAELIRDKRLVPERDALTELWRDLDRGLRED